MFESEELPDARPWEQREFVFVAGMHRSGTTLLAKIIGSSSDSTGLESSGAHMGEGQFLQDVYPIGKTYGGTNEWALDPRSHLTEVDARNTPDAARRLWDAWSEHWDLSKKYLVEKTPLNLTKTRFLQELFPNSTFIVITRHPITQSLAVRKWGRSRLRRRGYDFARLIRNWVLAHEAFLDDQKNLTNVRVVRYEDLVADPERALAPIQDALAMTFPNAAAEFDGSRASTYQEDWRRLTNGAINAMNSVHGLTLRGRSFVEGSLMTSEARKAVRLYSERVRALGYDLENLDTVSPWPLHV